jgi:hypothetical protein
MSDTFSKGLGLLQMSKMYMENFSLEMFVLFNVGEWGGN